MAQKKLVLCDTNILIELSKKNPLIIKELRDIGLSNIVISSITAGEFIFGALNKDDLVKIKKALNAVLLIQTTEAISIKALELLECYSLSHNLAVPDAFIAATAIILNLQIYTLNIKDFRYIDGLKLYESTN
jgi:predicted nucleic acid-binding protein